MPEPSITTDNGGFRIWRYHPGAAPLRIRCSLAWHLIREGLNVLRGRYSHGALELQGLSCVFYDEVPVWESEDGESGSVHVLPLNDRVEHVASEDCICGPTATPETDEDGSVGWVHVHHSLDGREQSEK